jgi:mRNA-degrading endonuclease RelE of RelBE toxin-antitoxin system
VSFSFRRGKQRDTKKNQYRRERVGFLKTSLDVEINSGYYLARMKYDIIFAPEARDDFNRLSARDRATTRDLIEKTLRYEPEKTSKSRIKRLSGMNRPQHRLRIGEIRVFYDVHGQRVEILAIIRKSEAAAWLESMGGKK